MADIRSRFKRAAANLAIGLLAFGQILVVAPFKATAATATHVVISQVQTGSGDNEFIELYNPTSSSVSLDGWSIQYRGGAAGIFQRENFDSGKTVPAHGYFLIANVAGSFAASADQLYNAFGLSPVGGTVFLVGDQVTLTALTATSTIDRVSYGTSSGSGALHPEGDVFVPAPGSGDSIVRKPDTADGNGEDNDTNSVDFKELSPSNARNTSSPISPVITPTPTPTPTVVAASAIDASITYWMNGVVGTQFGQGSIQAQVTLPSGAVIWSDNPTITFSRPNSAAVTMPLNFDSATNTWMTPYAFVASQSNGTQDGAVTVSLSTTTGKTFTIVSGGSFVLDTFVNKPDVNMMSRCSGSQDSFTATTDTDAQYVYIYKHSNLELSQLVAVSAVSNGSISEVYLGDNVFSSLYVVAKDAMGNTSATSVVENDMTAPAVPNLQLEAGTNVITATWAQVAGASEYRLKWREVGSATWQEKTVTTFKHDLSVRNDVEYEVSVTSRDTACNESAAWIQKGTARPLAFFQEAARGGIAEHESAIFAQAMMIAETKDGEATLTAAEKAAQEEAARKEAEQKEAEKKAAEEKQREEEQKAAEVKDRSNLIVTIAIILIIAGIAIAAYSWYQGDGSEVAKTAAAPKPVEEVKPVEEKTEAAAAPESESKASNKKKGNKPKRKTRW